MKKQIGKRILSFLLLTIMLYAFVPSIGGVPVAMAADSGSIGSVGDSTLQSLGFNTDTGTVDTFKNNSANKPTGNEPFSLFTVNELQVSSGHKMYLYDVPNGSISNGRTQQKTMNFSTTGASSSVGAQIRSVELDWTGSGKPDHIAQILAYRTTSSSKPKTRTAFELRLINSGTNTLVSAINLGEIPFQTTDHALGALLAITAGDFNDDGKDEIAIYDPAANATNVLEGLPRIKIFTRDGGGKINASPLRSEIVSTVSGMIFDATNKDNSDGREFPSVSLAAVRQTGEADDLAIAVSYARYADARKNGTDTEDRWDVSKLIVWKNPISGSNFDRHILRSWHDGQGYGFDSNPTYNGEMMMFPGVDAGDINGDGVSEIVVAGYRLTNVDLNKKQEWDLDRDRMLVNYYSYNTENQKYAPAGHMQWISTKDSDYGKAFSSTNRFDNGGLSSEKDYLMPPPPVAVFAERGHGYHKSVFVGGYVLALPTTGTGMDQQELEMGMYGGFDKRPKGDYAGGATQTFRIRYAAPLGYVENDNNGHDENGGFSFVSSMNERAILEATVGNFDSNPMGREQVAFTYLVKRQGYNQYNGIVCILNHKGEATNTVGNKAVSSYRDTTVDNINGGVEFSAWLYTGKDSTYAAITVCAPDSDDDSVIMKYNTSKSPDFYFTDPQIIAVLQAAPYFSTLDQDYYDEPETSVTKTTGGGSTDNHAASVSVGASFGIHVEGGAGPVLVQMSLAELEVIFGASVSAGYEMNHEKIASTSVSFNASYQDTVALTMSSYVRYYYEQWEPIDKKWKESFIDVPVTTATSQISVNMYDRIAEQNGWMTLRDNVLGGTQAGRPATYSPDKPDATYTNTGKGFDFKDGVLIKLGDYDPLKSFMQVGKGDGSISQSISLEETYEHVLTWGASFSVDAHARVFVVQQGVSFGADYTGGHGWVSFNGMELSGTVPNIPEDKAGDYNFSWEIGAWFRDITADGRDMPNCLIVGYRVKDIIALPEPPEDLKIDETTSNSVKLTWSDNATVKAEYYVLSRVVGGFFFPLVTVEANSAGAYSFTDNNCDPGTRYEYAIRTYEFKNNWLKASKWSDAVTAITPGTSVLVTHPRNINVRPGQNASFTAAVPGATAAQYQWEINTDGIWETIHTQGNSSTYWANNVTDLMGGNQYRCIIRAMIGNIVETIYTNPATLTVGKTDTTTTFSISDTSGAARHYTSVVENENVEAEAPIIATYSGTEYYVMKAADGSTPTHYLVEITKHTEIIGGETVTIYDLGGIYAAGASDDLNALVTTAKTDNKSAITLTEVPIEITSTQNFVDALTSGSPLFTTDILDHLVLEPNLAYNPEDPDSGSEFLENVELQFDVGDEGTKTTNYQKYEHGGNVLYEAVVAIGTHYYTSDSGTGFTRIYLDDTVTYAAGSVDMSAFNPEGATQESALVTKPVPVTKQVFTTGDSVTLTANVTSNAANDNETPNGRVSFHYTNMNTGMTASISIPLTNGSASIVWTPPEVGEYSITAQYTGNDLFMPSQSVAGTYLAFATYNWLGLGGASGITYGDSVDLEPAYYEVGQSGVENRTDAIVAYEVKNANGDNVTASVMEGNVFTPKLPGAYTVSAQYEAYTATKRITVSKKPITVKANKQSLDISDLKEPTKVNDITDTSKSLVVDGLVSGDTIDGLFTLTVALPSGVTSAANLGTGSYTIRVTPNMGDSYTAFAAKYEFMPQNGMLTIDQTIRHEVAINAGANGSVLANLEGGVPIRSGNKIADGLTVALNAIPDSGYAVDKWTVTVDGQTEEYSGLTNVDVTATGDISASVTFAAKSFDVTYSSNDNGTMLAKYDNATGFEIESGTQVYAGSNLYFEAVPNTDYYVKQWLVNGEVLKNQDGSSYTENTYTIPKLSESLNVVVEFAYIVKQSFSAQAVDINGNPLSSALGVVIDDAARLADGTVASGSNFTITASPMQTAGYRIREWRSYASNGQDYVVLQGNVAAYSVRNLQQDLDIRVVFETPQNYSLTFKAEPTGDGTLTAKNGDVSLVSGQSYQAYIPVTLTAMPNSGYMVDSWWVNGQKIADYTDKSYTIASLSKNTEVVVRFTEIIPPVISFPTAETLTYGQTLGDSILTGGSTQYGTFAWEDGDIVPTVSNTGYNVTFTPSDDAMNTYGLTEQTSAVLVQVEQSEPTVLLTVDGDTHGQEMTYTAAVSKVGMGEIPTGTVTFYDCETPIGTANLIDGVAEFTKTDGLHTGTHTIKAVYNGSDDYKSAAFTLSDYEVGKAEQSAFSIDAAGVITYGDTGIVLSTTGGSGTGDVKFSVAANNKVVELVGDSGALNILGAGTVTVTAVKAGDVNYNPITAILEITVNRKTMTATVTPLGKVYDGTTAVSGWSVAYSGFAYADDEKSVFLNGGALTFADKNVGALKAVMDVGFALAGEKASNYELLPLVLNTAEIAVKPVQIMATVSGKIYDKTTSATWAAEPLLVSSVPSDDVALINGVPEFEDANTGAGKTIILSSDFILSGADAANYNLKQPQGLKADIAPRDITGAKITITGSCVYHNATQLTPEITVEILSATLEADTEYEAEYGANQYPGFLNGSVAVKGIGNYTGSNILYFDIDKAIPDYELPNGLTSVYGQTLADVALPEGFTWLDDPATSVGEPGVHSFEVLFTPTDAANYETVTDTVDITVDRATPVIIKAPKATSVTRGGKLSSSTLSGGEADVPGTFAWENAEESVNASGDFTVIFTPDDAVHYKNVTLQVYVSTLSSGGGGGGGGSVTTYYTVAFDADGGSAVESQRVARNGKATKPTDPTKDGFAFAGWYSDKELAKEYDFDKSVTADITIYAKWTENKKPVDPVEPTDPKWNNPFIDVNASDWFYSDVEYVHTNGIFNGTSANTFSPNLPMTRAMLVTVLWRVNGSPAAESPIVSGTPFTDVASGQYYTEAVAWAEANGIVNGIGGGLFAPDVEITREQMAAILWRYAKFAEIDVSAGEDTNILSYNDAFDVSEYAITSMQWACGTGIISGKPGSLLDPQGSATRAEVAAMLHRFMESAKQ